MSYIYLQEQGEESSAECYSDIPASVLSAESWARHAIGGDKRPGPEGFENYRSQGGWYHPMHYRKISQSKPEWSSADAADEMSDIRESLVLEIEAHAKELDAMVMRLQRMEEQMGVYLSNTGTK